MDVVKCGGFEKSKTNKVRVYSLQFVTRAILTYNLKKNGNYFY